MATSIRLKECRDEDAAAVLALWRRAEAVPRPTDRPDALRQRIQHDDGLFLVAVDGDRVVGSLIGSWDGWRAGLARLAVDPEYRRRGIATRLVAEVERRQLALGAERSTIRVFHNEPGAVAFWTSLGYVADPDESIYVKGLER